MITFAMLGKSDWKCRYSSCSAPESFWVVATCPVIAINAEES